MRHAVKYSLVSVMVCVGLMVILYRISSKYYFKRTVEKLAFTRETRTFCKVRKAAKISIRYNQVPHLTQTINIGIKFKLRHIVLNPFGSYANHLINIFVDLKGNLRNQKNNQI